MPKLVILESPFGCDPEEMVKYGRKALKHSVLKGEAPIASHLLFTQAGVLDDKNREERSLGIAAGHAWMTVAEACVVYTDFGISEGMKLGIKRARSHGIEVLYREIGQDGLDAFDSDFYGAAASDYLAEGAEDERERISRELAVKAARLRFGQGCDLLGQLVDEIAEEVLRPPEPTHKLRYREERVWRPVKTVAFDPDLDDDVPF